MESSRKGGFGKGGKGGGFRKTGGFNDRKSFSKPSFGGDYKKKPWDNGGGKNFNNDDREMFQATCSGCGKSCQVPFRPSSGKPVFCDECFVKTRNGDGPTRSDSRPSYNDRGDRGTRPAPVQSTGNTDVLARQMQVISGKLDTLIDLFSRQSQPAKSQPVVESPAKKEAAPNIELKAAVKKAVKASKPVVTAKAAPVKKVTAKKVAKTAKKK